MSVKLAYRFVIGKRKKLEDRVLSTKLEEDTVRLLRSVAALLESQEKACKDTEDAKSKAQGVSDAIDGVEQDAQKLAQVTQETIQQVQSLEPAIETTRTALGATAGAAVSFSATVDAIEARAQQFAKSVEAFRLFVSQCEKDKQGKPASLGAQKEEGDARSHTP